VRTSVKVRHYIPDAVVSSYSNTGENPWVEVRPMSTPNPSAQAGGDGTTNEDHENNLAKFKNAMSSGIPASRCSTSSSRPRATSAKARARRSCRICSGTLDTLAWRYNVPEMAYPEALIPGMREVGARTTMNLWGNVYPRGGFLHQTDDHKASAVVAQRAGDVVTRRGQLHVYQPLLANSRDGYWPAGALVEGDASTGKWQELTPVLSSSCSVFPRSGSLTQARQGDYAWALWRPYACCERRGQVFPRQRRFPLRYGAMKFRPAFNPFSRRVRRTRIVLAVAGALALTSGVAWQPRLGYQTGGSVIGDDVMYSIGGGSAVSMGRAAGMRFSGSAWAGTAT
jgi:integrating conjugative element protein (TIGR03756 family)